MELRLGAADRAARSGRRCATRAAVARRCGRRWAPPGSPARCRRRSRAGRRVAGTALVVAPAYARAAPGGRAPHDPARGQRGAARRRSRAAIDRVAESPANRARRRRRACCCGRSPRWSSWRRRSARSGGSTRERHAASALAALAAGGRRCWRGAAAALARRGRAAVARRRRPASAALIAALAAPALGGARDRTTFLYDTLSYHLHVPATWMHDRRLDASCPPCSAIRRPPTRPATWSWWFLFLMAPLRSDYLAGVGQLPFAALAAAAIVAAVREAGGRRTRRARRRAGVRADSRGLGPDADRDDRPRAGGAACWRRCRSRSPAGRPPPARADLLAARRAIGPGRRDEVRGRRAGAAVRRRSARAAAARRGRIDARRRAFAARRRRLATGGFWYVRNAAVTGNPFYPVAVRAGCRCPRSTAAPRCAPGITTCPSATLGALGAMLLGARHRLRRAPRAGSRCVARLARARRAERCAAAGLSLLVAIFWFVIPYQESRFLFAAFGVAAMRDRARSPGPARRPPPRSRSRSSARCSSGRLVDRLLLIPAARSCRRAALRRTGAARAPLGTRPVAMRRRPSPRRRSRVALAIGAARVRAPRSRLHRRRRDSTAAWAWFRANVRDARVAYTGTNLAFPLAGERLANRVPYVNVAGAPGDRLHDFGPPPATGTRRARALPATAPAPTSGWRNLRAARHRGAVRRRAGPDRAPQRSPPTATASRSSAPGPTRAPTRFTCATPRPTRARLRGDAAMSARRRRAPRAASAGGAAAVRRRALPGPDGRDRSVLQPAPRRDRPARPRRAAHEPAVVHLSRLPRRQPGLAVPDRPRARPPRGRHPGHAAAEDGVRARRRWPCCFAWRSGAGRTRPPPRRRSRSSAWAAEPRFVERPHLVHVPRPGADAARPRARRVAGARARSTRSFRAGSSGPTRTPASSWRRWCWRSTRSARASTDAARTPGARRCAPARWCPLIFATPSGVHALGYIANHWRMPWLRPLQEYVPRALARSTRPPRSSRRASSLAADPARSPLAPAVARRAAGPASARAATASSPSSRCCRRRSSPCALTDAVARRAGAHDRGAPRQELGRIATVGRRRAARRRGDRAAHRAPSRRGGRAFDLGLDPTLVPPAAIAFAERQRPARPDVQRHRGRLVPDLGGVAPPPRVPGPAHQRLPAGVPRAASPRRSVARANGTRCWPASASPPRWSPTPAENPRAAFFDPARWALVYRAADGLVFVRAPARVRGAGRPRRDPGDASLRSRDRRRAAGPRRAPAGSPVTECEWQRRLGDFFVETRRRPRARWPPTSAARRRPGASTASPR